jgi:hypothetical protein
MKCIYNHENVLVCLENILVISMSPHYYDWLFILACTFTFGVIDGYNYVHSYLRISYDELV